MRALFVCNCHHSLSSYHFSCITLHSLRRLIVSVLSNNLDSDGIFRCALRSLAVENINFHLIALISISVFYNWTLLKMDRNSFAWNVRTRKMHGSNLIPHTFISIYTLLPLTCHCILVIKFNSKKKHLPVVEVSPIHELNAILLRTELKSV